MRLMMRADQTARPRNRSGMADFTTRGQQLALDQLQDIAAASDDTIDIVDVKPPAGQGLSLVIRVSIDTSGYAYEGAAEHFRVAAFSSGTAKGLLRTQALSRARPCAVG